MKKIFCVISHTHWDREWYLPFEQFRMKLVDLIDNLLDIFDEYPEYVFHLDAQTIVLEDYLEIRPYRRDELKKYIHNGNIIVGPWYVQNDFYLTSGEATIRNLLIGIRIACEFGASARIGYMPDQFGLTAQLPQIFKGFDINSCIFGRGYNGVEDSSISEIEVKRSEFLWEGPDGTKILAILMPFWYNNAQRFSEDIKKSLKLLQKVEKDFEGIAMSPYLLLMNGVDHLEAQENLIPILKELNIKLSEDKEIKQTTMEHYINQIHNFYNAGSAEKSLPLYRGELRGGNNYHVLQGTLSSRVYLKQLNNSAQHKLQNRLEPLYSFIEMNGGKNKYPKDYLDYLWKLLIQNHPHDSICGCSRDEVHRHMEDKFARIKEASDELIRRGMEFISYHIDRKGISEDEYLLTVFNSLQHTRTEVIEAELQFPEDENIIGFKIYDHNGSEVFYEIIDCKKKEKDITSPINLPGVIKVDSFKIRMKVNEIPGFSQRTYRVRKSEQDHHIIDNSMDKPTFPINFENNFIKVSINENGEIDLFDKETAKCFNNIIWLEDREDCGDSYVYNSSPVGVGISTSDMKPYEIKCVTNTDLLKEYVITYELNLPIDFNRQQNRRNTQTIINRVDIKLSLSTCSKWLEISVEIDNKSKDHRLRAIINTGLRTEFTNALEPFETIVRDRREVLKGLQNGDQPNSGFVDISDGTSGVTILNKGLYEYQHLLGDEGRVAITLFRGNGLISITSSGDNWMVPDNQCIRRISGSIGLYIHGGNADDGSAVLAGNEFNNSLMNAFHPADVKKFCGGRPAVQESEIKELFYRKDGFSNVKLELQHGSFSVYGKNIIVSSVKRAEKADAQIIRLYNTGKIDEEAVIIYPEHITSVQRVNLEENYIDQLGSRKGMTKLILKPAEIATVELK